MKIGKIMGLSLGVVVCALMFSLCLFVITGCETGEGTVSLTVEPSFIDLTSDTSNTTQTQTFTVTGGLRSLSLPLEWSVSDTSLGYIGSSGGESASYVRLPDAHGDNSIIVVDQYGAEGVATVRQ